MLPVARSGVTVAVAIGLPAVVAMGLAVAVGVDVDVGEEVTVRVALFPTSCRNLVTAFTACDVGPVYFPDLVHNPKIVSEMLGHATITIPWTPILT